MTATNKIPSLWVLFLNSLERKPSVTAVDQEINLRSGAGISQKLFRESSETISAYISLWHEHPELYGAIKNIIQIA